MGGHISQRLLAGIFSQLSSPVLNENYIIVACCAWRLLYPFTL